MSCALEGASSLVLIKSGTIIFSVQQEMKQGFKSLNTLFQVTQAPPGRAETTTERNFGDRTGSVRK